MYWTNFLGALMTDDNKPYIKPDLKLMAVNAFATNQRQILFRYSHGSYDINSSYPAAKASLGIELNDTDCAPYFGADLDIIKIKDIINFLNTYLDNIQKYETITKDKND